jgi:hypothetical protein
VHLTNAGNQWAYIGLYIILFCTFTSACRPTYTIVHLKSQYLVAYCLLWRSIIVYIASLSDLTPSYSIDSLCCKTKISVTYVIARYECNYNEPIKREAALTKDAKDSTIVFVRLQADLFNYRSMELLIP